MSDKTQSLDERTRGELEQLDNWFTYHAASEEQRALYSQINSKTRELAEFMLLHTPPCADRSDAIRQIRNLRMRMNMVIACNG